MNRIARGVSSGASHGRDRAIIIAASSVEYSGKKTRPQVKCFTCGKIGHCMRDCRWRQQSNDSSRQTRLGKLHTTTNHDNTGYKSKNGNECIGSSDSNVEHNSNAMHPHQQASTYTLNTSTTSEPPSAQVLHACTSSAPAIDNSTTDGTLFTFLTYGWITTVEKKHANSNFSSDRFRCNHPLR